MGIESLLQQNVLNAGLAGTDRLARNAMFPQSQMDKTQYAVPSQMPTSAETIRSDYDAPTNAYTGLPVQPFAKGGIASIPRFNGEDGSGVDVFGETGWDPASGQVKLQKLSDPNDPFSETTNVNYTIPKDNIKQFVPNDEGLGGQYILNDGSTMYVGGDGTVQSATPGRNDYTLNEQGYYQPTGENLTWRGDQNMLTKKIGGVDVNVPGIYHKGGYKDQEGNLRVDANGVPIPLAPNYLDSGAGESGLSDAAPYITALALTAMGMPTGAMAFEGMVPASETVMGSLGSGATASGGFGLNASQVPNLGASLGATGGTTAGTGATGFSLTAPSAGYTFGGINAGALGTGVPASLAMPTTGALAGGAGATSAGLTAKQAYAAKMGLDMLNSGMGGNQTQGGGGVSSTVAAAPTIPQINRFGITGYEGIEGKPADYKSVMELTPKTYLSKLRGVPGEQTFNQGGIADLGGYSDGGRLLRGPGDGMSDNIPASIGGKQPARLADGEFVIPADVVSHLGNGSTDAGAKQLYKMMDRIRKARTGNKKQGKQINPNKFLP